MVLGPCNIEACPGYAHEAGHSVPRNGYQVKLAVKIRETDHWLTKTTASRHCYFQAISVFTRCHSHSSQGCMHREAEQPSYGTIHRKSNTSAEHRTWLVRPKTGLHMADRKSSGNLQHCRALRPIQLSRLNIVGCAV